MSQSLAWTGEKIKTLRKQLGWSQAELSKRLGCRQQTVSEWETNIYSPQNAYSQLLDRLFESSQNFGDGVTKPSFSKIDSNRAQHQDKQDQIGQDRPKDSLFDTFID